MTRPAVAVVVPCFNEVGYVEDLLATLLPQLADAPHWSLVLVDDSSTDGTGDVLNATAAAESCVTALRGPFGSPGRARSAGFASALAASPRPDWLVTVDADVEIAPDWFGAWEATLAEVHGDHTVGAVNGLELQDHLFVGLPNAARVSAAFGRVAELAESVVGITNLNGVNHGLRSSAYHTCGPYVQPTMPGPVGELLLAGSDWDLGVRVRCAGFSVAGTPAAVRDRGRRLLADVHAYVSGEAYEGAFRRVVPNGPPLDVSADDVGDLIVGATERSLRHFLLKPILAGVTLLEGAEPTLTQQTRLEIAQWIDRWPHPRFEDSRNGFIFGRLARFSEHFTDAVQADLGLRPLN